MEWGIVILIRLLVPLTALKWKLFGSILGLIADTFDVVILDFLGTKDFNSYSRFDKFMDTYFYLILGYTLLSFKNIFVKKAALVLLGYRLAGVIIFELINFRPLLFIFPDLFIFLYMYYLIYKKITKKEPFSNFKSALPVLTILLIVKLAQEYMLHVAQFPIYDFIKNLTPFLLIMLEST